MRFFRTPSILPYFYPSLLWRKEASARQLFLTFDDGPIPDVTGFVLQTLDSYKVKGTFFCIGDNVRKHPDVFQKVTDNDHAIGNHTYNHLNGWNTKTSSYVDNVARCQEQLKDTTLFRPPFGRISRSQIKALKDYKIVMWDVLTFDYDRSLDSEKCLRGSLNAIRPGSIIVFHDSIKAEKNVKYVLPRFIDSCLSQGYSFEKL